MKGDANAKVVRWSTGPDGNVRIRVLADEPFVKGYLMPPIEAVIPFELLASLYQVACDERGKAAQRALDLG